MRYFVIQDNDGAYVLWRIEDGARPIGHIVAENPLVNEEARHCTIGGSLYIIREDGVLIEWEVA